MIELSADLQISEVEYANQGNAILGIRDSGKSYTATWFAERLLDAGVPFVAFDPIGVWRNLKLPGKGKGYEVVVAGDNADLPLSPESAPEIVRAAMRENIPLVIDLYSMALSKADWKKIVQSCVQILLYENGRHGLRHIFIEEAAEFAPQRVGPDQGRVYAEIEKLARMGGNAGLGYTLINQRAEEVNKAVLELCDCLFLHRQKGRHSITALGKWLDAADASNAREITKSLPSLEQGQCWVWRQGSKSPELVQIPVKRSHHPDRRNLAATRTAAKAQTDVSGFVGRLTAAIGAAAEAKQPTEAPRGKDSSLASLPSAQRVGELVEQLEAAQRDRALAQIENRSLHEAIGRFADQLVALADGMRNKPAPLPEPTPAAVPRPTATERFKAPAAAASKVVSAGQISAPGQKILSALSFWRSVGYDAPSRPQIAAVAGYSPDTGNFRALLGKLGTDGHVAIPAPGCVSLSPGAPSVKLTRAQARERMLEVLSDPEQKLLMAAFGRSAECTRTLLAELTGYSPDTGNFRALIGRLCTLQIFTKPGPSRIALSRWARELIAG